MRKVIILSLFMMVVTGGVPHHIYGDMSGHPRDMSFTPLTFAPPKGDRITLNNGMVLYVLEDQELPLFNLSAVIRTGSIYDPTERVGLAQLTGKVMRTGGTKLMEPDEINDQLEYIAGSVEIGIGRESGSASLSVMKKDIDFGLKIFSDILMNPRFDQSKLDLAKKQKIEAIRRRNDNPSDIAFREFRRVLYKGNPRGRISTFESINAITRQDLIEFHDKFFRPGNMLFAVSGDFKKDVIIKKLEQTFQGWRKSPVSITEAPLPEYSLKRSIHYAFKDVSQSTIVLGHLAVSKTDPDYYPFTVLNFILGGGGFNSRLTSEIRSNRGLAYSVGSFYRGDVEYGVFAAICMTKSSTTYQAISLIEKIITETKENGVTEEELTWAKESIINKFIFTFTSSASVVNQQMWLEYDKLPDDYLQKYQENVSLVTHEDIRRVAKKYLHPDKSLFVIVGNGEAFDKPLSLLGEVTEIELKNTDESEAEVEIRNRKSTSDK
ncbi:MAG: pitrilysin family protein [Thermodesulfobacteriota bacterium]|nr:pitrilysin family protein [Thermodesulfobacteriota bacterium]